MDAKSKKILIVGVAIVLLVVILAFVFTRKGKTENPGSTDIAQSQEGQPNTSEKLNETKGFEGLSFTKIRFENGKGGTDLKTTVTNTTNTTYGEKDKHTSIGVNLLDKNGNIITHLTGVIDALEPGESTEMRAIVAATYKNIYDVQFVEEK